MDIILIIIGLTLLIGGAELLVRGSSNIANHLGVHPIVIGLTVVAFGTSTPELAVGIKAGLAGQTGIVLGNVIGSNIFNILFILGISAIIVPLAATARLVRFDVPVMIGAAFIVWILALNHHLGHLESILVLAGFVGYVILITGKSFAQALPEAVREFTANEKYPKRPKRPMPVYIIFILVGLGLLWLGSRWLVDGAVSLARSIGISEMVIGLTIVAAGTSLPEAATSIIAGIHKEKDIAVGNIVGSNIFNIGVVLTVSAIVSKNGLSLGPAVIYFDIPFMIAASLVCLPVFFTGGKISRGEGALLLGCYLLYIGFLISYPASQWPPRYLDKILWFVIIPVILIAAIISTIKAFGSKKAEIE